MRSKAAGGKNRRAEAKIFSSVADNIFTFFLRAWAKDWSNNKASRKPETKKKTETPKRANVTKTMKTTKTENLKPKNPKKKPKLYAAQLHDNYMTGSSCAPQKEATPLARERQKEAKAECGKLITALFAYLASW